jgi:hypothetical protein
MNKQPAAKTFYPLFCNPSKYSIDRVGNIYSNNKQRLLAQGKRKGRATTQTIKVGSKFIDINVTKLLMFQFEDMRDPKYCRPASGFESRYVIHIDGSVCDMIDHHFMNTTKDSHGFDRVVLKGDNGKQYSIRVAKLIQQTFYSEIDFKEFIPVKYDNMYLINKAGTLYSLKSSSILTHQRHDGYLYYNVKFRPNSVHRVLAEHFIPNPNNHNEVDHIDGDTYNNSLENLRWCTHQANSKNRLNHYNIITLEHEDSTKVVIEGWDNMKDYLKVSRHTILNNIKQYHNTGLFIKNGALRGYRIYLGKV